MKDLEITREVREGLISRAREMRSNPTEAEGRLWEFLKEHQLGGLKFRRQHKIGRYIVDFYCPSRKTVLEIDGPIHKNHREQDRYREEALVEMGYKVIRISNQEILENIDAVLRKIDLLFCEGTPSSRN